MNTTPSNITLDADALHLQWASGPGQLQADFLRAQCRCTQCRQASVRGGTQHASTPVTLVDASPVGSYGLQLHFSDGHDRGIYPWAYLHELAHRAVADVAREAM
ncbi:MAG: gamma-butyrobetaine hydroxylase-like domain-containing protein [Pseudomonadota bacterium]